MQLRAIRPIEVLPKENLALEDQEADMLPGELDQRHVLLLWPDLL